MKKKPELQEPRNAETVNAGVVLAFKNIKLLLENSLHPGSQSKYVADALIFLEDFIARCESQVGKNEPTNG